VLEKEKKPFLFITETTSPNAVRRSQNHPVGDERTSTDVEIDVIDGPAIDNPSVRMSQKFNF
jgi:hypothetical protein